MHYIKSTLQLQLQSFLMVCVCLSVLELSWLNGFIIFNCQLITLNIDWITPQMLCLCTIRSFGWSEIHIAMKMNASAIMYAVLLIGMANTKLVILHVGATRFWNHQILFAYILCQPASFPLGNSQWVSRMKWSNLEWFNAFSMEYVTSFYKYLFLPLGCVGHILSHSMECFLHSLM